MMYEHELMRDNIHRALIRDAAELAAERVLVQLTDMLGCTSRDAAKRQAFDDLTKRFATGGAAFSRFGASAQDAAVGLRSLGEAIRRVPPIPEPLTWRDELADWFATYVVWPFEEHAETLAVAMLLSFSLGAAVAVVALS